MNHVRSCSFSRPCAESAAYQLSECALKSASNSARRTVADFSAVNGSDRNDFRTRAEHQDLLEFPELTFEAWLSCGPNGLVVGERKYDIARDAGQNETGQWRSNQDVVFDKQNARVAPFMENAIATEYRFVCARFDGLLICERIGKQRDRFYVASAPPLVCHNDCRGAFLLKISWR